MPRGQPGDQKRPGVPKVEPARGRRGEPADNSAVGTIAKEVDHASGISQCLKIGTAPY
jgi:hypothetical protein